MNNDLLSGAGCALVIISVLLGIGGCAFLMKLGDAKVNESRKVVITNSFNTIK